MLIKTANKWADWLILNGADAEDRDVYVYGAECTFNELISNALLIAVALFLNKALLMLSWLIFFTPIRTHLGGFHASSHFKCIFYSLVLGLGCITVYPFFVERPLVLMFSLLASIVLVFLIAPVTHPNHPFSLEKQKKIRKKAIAVILVESAALLILFFFFSKSAASVGVAGVLAADLLGIFGKLLKK